MVVEYARLVPGKGSTQRGGGPGGRYWHIYQSELRVGYVFINIIDTPPIGLHASIQIHVNAAQRGKGIGREAYQQACEHSGQVEIYAHMRKSNLASRRAAEHAGFKVISEYPQLTLHWQRPS